MGVRRLRILLISDRSNARDWIFDLLRRSDLGPLDLDFIPSHDLKSHLMSSDHDVCLIDSHLDRAALVAQVRLLGVKAPVIMLTGDSGCDVLNAIHQGAADCLIKDHLTGAALEESICAVIEKARTLESQAEYERYYLSLVENTTEIIYTHDLKGNCTSVNHVGENAFGYSREEMKSMNIRQIVMPDCLDGWERSIERLLERRKSEKQQLVMITKDRRLIPLVVINHLIYKDGAPIGVQGVAHVSTGTLPYRETGSETDGTRSDLR